MLPYFLHRAPFLYGYHQFHEYCNAIVKLVELIKKRMFKLKTVKLASGSILLGSESAISLQEMQ